MVPVGGVPMGSNIGSRDRKHRRLGARGGYVIEKTATRGAVALSLTLCLFAAAVLASPAASAAAATPEGTPIERGTSGVFREAGDWPAIHHDSRNSGVLPDGAAAPVKFRLRWSALRNASVLSAPVVGDDGRIYVVGTQQNFRWNPVTWLAPLARLLLDPLPISVGSRSKISEMLGSGLLLSRLYAIDRSSGRIIWQKAEISLSGMAGAPLLLRNASGDMSIVASGLGKVIAYDRNGAVRWRSSLGPLEVAISPHLYSDGRSLLVGTNTGSVYLKDAATGRDLLPPHRPAGLVNTNTPGVSDDGKVILIGVHASDPEDGVAWAVKPNIASGRWRKAWTFEGIAGDSQTSPTIGAAGDRVYVGDGHAGLIAIDLSSGGKLWRHTFIEVPGWHDYLYYASPAATPEGLLAVNLIPARVAKYRNYSDIPPMYVAVLRDCGDRAEGVYLKDWKVTSNVSYSVGSGRFYFAAMKEASDGRPMNVTVSLDIRSGESFSQPLQNPVMNNITLADGAIVVPVFWGGLIGLPLITTRGYGLHYYEEADSR